MKPRLLRCVCAAATALLVPGAWAMWPTETSFLVGDDRGVISLIDLESGKVVHAFPYAPRLGEPRRGARTARLSYEAKRPLRIQNPHRLAAEVVIAADGSRFAHSPQGGRDTYVWNLRSGRLELIVPGASALGFLGRSQERLAVAGKSAANAPELAVWNVAAGRQVLGRPLFPGARMLALPLASTRFAAFTLDQRELWLWDDEKRSLRRLELPPEYFIAPPLRINAEGTRLLVTGGAGRREIIAFDPASGKVVRRYPVETGNPPAALGWTLGGRHIVAHQPPDMLLFDAGTGAIAHRWRYKPATRLSIERKLLREPRLELRLHDPVRDEPLLSPHGDRLALVDPPGGALVVWDLRVLPPERLNDLCVEGRCGEQFGTLSFPWFSPGGRSVVVHGEDRLWVVDAYSGEVRERRIDVLAIAAKISQLEIPSLSAQTCHADFPACARAAADLYLEATRCAPRDPQSTACRMRKEALPWVQAVCARAGGTHCESLERLAKALGDARLERLGFAGHCARTRKGCGPPGEALGAEEPAALLAQCGEDPVSCALAARYAANAAGGAKLAAELARRGCDAGYRDACMAGGRYEQACFIKEDQDCLDGMREASRGVKPPARAKLPAPVYRPQLCEQFGRERFIGVRYFEAGEFAGIKVSALRPHQRESWPFSEGDVLLNTIRCKPERCSAENFVREVAHLCRTDRDKLLHDLIVEVRSADPKRSRAYLLREAE